MIVEASLPNERKTVKSVDVGGVAGGEKFLSHNLFVKRVMDDSGLYGGLEVRRTVFRSDCIHDTFLSDHSGFRVWIRLHSPFLPTMVPGILRPG